MNIAVASDENYVPHLVTLLTSIGENNPNMSDVNIYIFDGGFSADSRKIIKELGEVYKNFNIIFYPVSEKEIAEKLGGGYLSQDRSLLTYARLLIPEVVAGTTCLYLDVDGIVSGNLERLSEIDFNGCAVMGVVDVINKEARRKTGVGDDDVYINAGMIWWNLIKCRKIGLCNMFREFIQKRKGDVFYMDQGTLNGVLSPLGLIKALPPENNVLTPFYQHSATALKRFYQLNSYYSDEELRNARENPFFVHFTPNATTRPWQKHCSHPLREKYWYYRNKTAFRGVRLANDTRSVKLRILHLIYRKFPLCVFGFVVKYFRFGKR